MDYRGYHFEAKTMIAGCQVTITHNDAFVRHSSVTKDIEVALAEARLYVDTLSAQL
jgi:hypothetical protein